MLELISWLILFYGVWCWIVTHGSKTQIEAKIKPRGQLWEKTPHCDVLDVKNLGQVHQIFPPLTANGSVDATSYIFQHPDISLCQKSATLCFDNSDIVMLDVLQPQEYTWDKGQHLLLMINVADWNIVSHLLSPQPVLFKIQKILAFLFSSDCALLSRVEQLVRICYLLWQKCIFHICADQRYRDMQHRWITCPCLADRTHFSLIIPDENVNISRNKPLMEASWQEQLKWCVG